MRRTFKYRIYPNTKQEKTFLFVLETCRWIYNNILEIKRYTYKQESKNLSRIDCNKFITQWKKEEDKRFIGDVYTQILQDVSDRVDKAYKSFFRRVKNKEKPGFPRFKSIGQYDSFTYTQLGFSLNNNNQILRLGKIGDIKIVYHRKIEGKIKTLTVKKTPTNKWYASFSCELPDVEKTKSVSNPIGVDCGLYNFITLSNGQTIDAQKFFRKSEEVITYLDQKLSSCEKGTPERREAKKRLGLAYEKVFNRRDNFAHLVSKQLVNSYDYIVFEDLAIRKMIKNHKLAKSIQDVAWNQLVRYTDRKSVV